MVIKLEECCNYFQNKLLSGDRAKENLVEDFPNEFKIILQGSFRLYRLKFFLSFCFSKKSVCICYRQV